MQSEENRLESAKYIADMLEQLAKLSNDNPDMVITNRAIEIAQSEARWEAIQLSLKMNLQVTYGDKLKPGSLVIWNPHREALREYGD